MFNTKRHENMGALAQSLPDGNAARLGRSARDVLLHGVRLGGGAAS